MRITKRQLRQIIRESAGAMPLVGIETLGSKPMSSRPGKQSVSQKFYSDKLKLIMMAVMALEELIAFERTSPMGEDPDLNDIYNDLLDYMEAVNELTASNNSR